MSETIQIILVITIIAYPIMAYLSFIGARDLNYGKGVSTMMGLLMPPMYALAAVINSASYIIGFVYQKLLELILILCGTDIEELEEREILALIEEE